MPKLFLIDGTALCYRAYYAIRQLTTSKGEPTNAIYGFITMMRKLVDEQAPDSVAVCFDRREPTFRHERYKQYKAHRKPMPEDLAEQLEPIKEFCRIYGLSLFEEAGFEADDLLGTLALKGEKQGFDVFIVTGDKDAMQLVNERIRIMNPHKENLILGTGEVQKRFDGLGPEKVVDVMALMGDSSDNIPGIPGIGEKTAIKLIHEFGSVENLITHANRLKSKSQQMLVKENKDLALLSKDLARIDTQVSFEIDWGKVKVARPNREKLAEYFKRYEFRNLFKEFMPEGGSQEEERRYELIETAQGLMKLMELLKKVTAVSFDTETTSSDPMRAHLVGMSFSWEPYHAVYIPVASDHHAGKGIGIRDVLQAVSPVLEDESIAKYGQNLKYDWIIMKRLGVELRGIGFDTMIASYLVNPIKRNHNLDDISLEYLGIRKISIESLIGTGKKQISMAEAPLDKVAEYAAEDADCVFRLTAILRQKLKEHDLEKLFSEVELPLAVVLAKIEMNGVNLDLKFLKELSENAGEDLERLTRTIHQEAGEEFNVDSPKQLADILFQKMRLPALKKTKTGYSTDVSVLEKLSLSYELPKMILEYREKAKLKSTYLDALPEMVNPETHLVHTSYNQTTTVTGRLSSSEPNLQNIPIKTETGRRVRKAFVPRKKTAAKTRQILSADYSQIELRILAHLSGDANLVKAFREDRDIHNFTATLLYGVSEKDVTRQMRGYAKMINFSVIYGKTAYGLSQEMNISISEADSFIDNYFKRYSGVRDYLESQKELAKKQGYLTTLLGRRSYFPDLHSKNVQLRQFAERAAINAPIQGSAADLIKLAMITIQRQMEEKELESLMIMQVHDELVFDVPATEKEEMTGLVKKSMEMAYSMKVPLRADVYVGDSWYKN